MSELMTDEEQIAALTRLGVPRERAAKAVAEGRGMPRGLGQNNPVVNLMAEAALNASSQFARELDRIMGVKFIRLPWSALLPDNAKYGVIKGRIINTREYRAAKKKARGIAIEQVGEEPFKGPVRFEARLWTPNPKTRDVANYSKLVNDALKGVAYVDDGQIDDNRWVRMGADIDAPRAEITVTLITP